MQWCREHRLAIVPLGLAAMGLALYAYRLGEVHFWSVAEGRSAMAARHMLAGGGWLVPAHPGANLLIDTPPLYSWLVACGFWLTGSHSEAAARFPSALAAAATLLVVYRLGLRMGGPRVGRTAALATGLCVVFVWQARLAEADTLLCLFVALAYSALERSLKGHGWHFAVFHGALGLAVMSKGLVGLVYIAAPLVVYLTWQREWRRVLGRRAFWAGLPVLLLVGGAWYGYVVLTVPKTVAVLSWSGAIDHIGHRETVYYYMTRLPLAMLPLTLLLPWVVLVPWTAGRGKDAESRDRGAVRLVFCWLAVPLVLLLLWPSKQTHYVLPMVPALGLLAAMALEQPKREGGLWSVPLRAGGAKLAAWLIPATCAVAAPVLAMQGHSGGAWLILGAAAVLTVVSLAARLALDWSLRFGLEAVLVEFWIVLLVACGHLVPEFNLEKSHKPFLRVVRQLVRPEEPLAGVQLRANDLFYLDRPVTMLADDSRSGGAGGYVVVPRRWLDGRLAEDYTSVLRSDAVSRNGDLVLIRVGPSALRTAERGRKR